MSSDSPEGMVAGCGGEVVVGGWGANWFTGGDGCQGAGNLQINKWGERKNKAAHMLEDGKKTEL